MATPDIVVLKDVRLGFPKLFTPEASVEGGPLKFSAHAIIDPGTNTGKANIETIKAAQKYVAQKQWGDKWQNVVKGLEKNRRAFRDGDSQTNSEGDIYAGYEGMKMVAAGRSQKQGRPQNLDRNKRPVAEEDGVLYAGCYVDMVVSFYTVTGKERGGNGVFASLEVVRFRRDGEAFGGGISGDAAASLLEDLDDDDLDDDSSAVAAGGDMDDDDDDMI